MRHEDSAAFALALAAFVVGLVACGGGAGPGESPAPDADTGGPARAVDSTPRDTGAAGRADTVRAVPPGSDPWTAGIVRSEPTGSTVSTLRSVRTAGHPEYDRVVWEFAEARPGVHVEYVDEPVRECGSGRAVPLPGDGWLEVRFEPAAAHVDGEATVEERHLAPGLPIVLEVVSTCDFEAVVTWVLAVAAPEPYRVLLLEDPPRVAIDVRRPAARPDR